jgi:hypothetical protein
MLIQLLHHPDQLVLLFFSVGFLVFLAARVATFFELEGTAFCNYHWFCNITTQ